MTLAEFREHVHYFVDMYVSEYMSDYAVTYKSDPDFDGCHEAIITMVSPYPANKRRDMRIKIVEDEPVIHTYEDDYFTMDAHGLYCWLWHEAESELSKLASSGGGL